MNRIRVIALTAFSALLPLLGLNATPTFTIQGGTLTAVELNGESEIIIPDGVTVIMEQWGGTLWEVAVLAGIATVLPSYRDFMVDAATRVGRAFAFDAAGCRVAVFSCCQWARHLCMRL